MLNVHVLEKDRTATGAFDDIKKRSITRADCIAPSAYIYFKRKEWI